MDWDKIHAEDAKARFAQLEKAAKRARKLIAEVAAGVGDELELGKRSRGSVFGRPISDATYRALERLEDVANSGDIRAHEPTAERASRLVSELRAAFAAAREQGDEGRRAARNAELRGLRERDLEEAEERRRRDPAGEAYRRELALDRARRGGR